MAFRNDLKSLLRPEDSVLVLIDHPATILRLWFNNATAAAKQAKSFNYYLGLRDRKSVRDQGAGNKLVHTIRTRILGDTGSTYWK